MGWVESSLADRDQAPLQGDEGAPDAWLVFEQAVSEGLRDLSIGTDLVDLEALHGTPVVDVKPVLGTSSER